MRWISLPRGAASVESMPRLLIPRRSGLWICAWIAWCVAVVAWPQSCRAEAGQQARILEQAVVTDPAGQMTLDQVLAQPQTVYAGALVNMRNPSVVWVRLRIAPPQDGAQAPPQRLRVVPMWQRSLALYDPVQRSEDGRIAPIDAPATNSVFDVQGFELARSTAPRDVWLRLEPSGPLYLRATVLSADESQARDASDSLVQGLAMGLQTMLIVAGLIVWRWDRRGMGPTLFLKQVFNLAIVLVNANLLGLTSTQPGEVAVEGLRFLNMAVSLWFFLRILQLLQVPRRVLWIQHASLVLVGLGSLTVAAGQLELARAVNLALVAVVSLGLVASSAFAQVGPADPVTPARRAWRVAQRAGLGLLIWAAWIASFAAGVQKAQATSFALVMIPVLTVCALGILLVVMGRRVAAERQRQAALRHRAELDALALDFERAERQRQQEFMTMLTHELKAPLSTLSLVIGSPSASATMLRHGQKALASMRQVIDHCAQSAQVDEVLPLAQDACCLAVELGLRLDAQADPRRFQLAPAPAWPDVVADRRMLAVILNNLLENATHYSPPGSPIHVRIERDTSPEGAVQRLSLSNQALEGPLPDASRLFQKYYRGDAAQRISGSGLGLHLSRQLARRMGGELSCHASGRELTFTLLLPEPATATAGQPSFAP